MFYCITLQGFSSSKTDQVRTDYVLTENYDETQPNLTLYVEMAANRIQFTNDGDLIGTESSKVFCSGEILNHIYSMRNTSFPWLSNESTDWFNVL